MSSAVNHAKRSHRSNYRAKAFNGGRKSVVNPTVSKAVFGQLIKMLRSNLASNKGRKDDE